MIDVTTPPCKTEAQPFRRLWRDWLRPMGGQLALAVLLIVVVAVASGAYAKVIQWVIAGFETDPARVILWGPLAVVAVTFARGVAQYLHSVLIFDARLTLETGLKKAMFAKLVHADLAQLQTEAPAGLAARFSSDISVAGGAVEAMNIGLMSLLTVLASFAVMLSIDWQMTMAIALIFFVAVYPVSKIGRKLRGISGETQRQISTMAARVSDGLSGILMVRTYQLEDRLIGDANGIFDDLQRLMARARSWSARIVPLMEVMGGLAVAALLCIVAWRLSRGTTTMADFMGLLTGLGVATTPARGLGQSYATAQQGAGALQRVFALLDGQNAIKDRADAKAGATLTGAIRFQGVSFAYPGGGEALKDVSFEVKAGSRVAFVGRSGAGKSTIFKLLPRLFEVTSGAIMLDGVDLRDLTMATLRRQIAVVSQDSILLAASVADNIGFGRLDAGRDEIIAAAKAAAADAFIVALPNGYDTELNLSAVLFSGGERQRLSIARAILRNAPVLLLDEPTSALDAESEDAIRTALRGLEAGRTTLIIAHRLATILDADKIVVLDDGRVVDQGTHGELLQRGGLYADLFRLQFAGM